MTSAARRCAAVPAALVLCLTLAQCRLDDVLHDPPGTPPAGGPATRLTFASQPSGTSAGIPIAPAVAVTAQDDSGRTDTTFAGTVTLALSGGGTAGGLGGTVSRAAAAGVATFGDLTLDQAGTYALAAASPGLAAATSAPFDVVAGAATILSLVSGSGQTDSVGASLPAAYVVRLSDGSGNPLAGQAVSWSVTAGGGSIAPAGPLTDASGTARATHALGSTIGPQIVRASVSGAASVTFTSTATAGNPAALAFTTQPADAAANAPIAPAVVVILRDRLGNTATGYAGSVTMAIASGTGTPGAALAGTRTRPVSGGSATFGDLSINVVGVAYRLSAAVGGVAVSSAPFDITIVSGTGPSVERVSGDTQSDTVAGTLGDPYVVRVSDGAGRPMAGQVVQWSVAGGGGAVAPASVVTDVGGLARATHTLGGTAGDQTVRATVAGASGSPVLFHATAAAGTAVALVYTQQPTRSTVNAILTPAVAVALYDQYGNVADGSTASVAIAIVTGTGTPLATLSGTRSRAVDHGLATFDDLHVDLVGAGYQLRATTGAISVTSTPFDVALF